MQSEECRVQKKRKWHSMSKNNRVLTIIVCIFLSIVIAFGAGFGIYFAIEEANTAVRLDSVRMDEGMVRVFSSYFKDRHISDLVLSGYHTARDTEEFWQSLHENGKTQGELYEASLKSYLSGILASANLYLSRNRLTDGDEKYIKNKTEAFISYYGGKDKFNEKAEEFGFNYDDFLRAMELSYTANLAFYSIYGTEGEALSGDEFLLRCEKYLESYSRVKMIFIARGEIFDDEIKDWRDLNAEEALQRENKINVFKDAVSDGSMIEETFDIYLTEENSLHDGDGEICRKGYYFKRGTTQTESFGYQEIVTAALDMKIGEVRAVDCGTEERGGVAFLYKCDVISGAYRDDENPFFSDFYQNAAYEFYLEDIDLLSEEAEFRDLYYEIDPIAIPKNKELFVTSWK